MLDEVPRAAGPAERRLCRVRRGDHLDDLGRVQGAATAGRDDPLTALVVGHQRSRGRVFDLDHHARAGWEEADHPLALDAVRLPHPTANQQHLDPQPASGRAESAHHRPDLGRAQLDHGPHVEQHPVPLRSPARLAVSLEPPDSLERVNQHPLQLGQRGQASTGIPDGGQVAHLGEREEALLLRVLARRAAKQVDVLRRRRQPLEREVREPPQPQPLGHLRMQAAEQLDPRPGHRRPRRYVNRSTADMPRPRAGSATAITTRSTPRRQPGARRAPRPAAPPARPVAGGSPSYSA